MSLSAWQRVRATALVAAIVLGTPLAMAAQQPVKQPPEQPVGFDLAQVSHDLQVVGDLFGGGAGKPVTFDAAAAAQRGLSPESIELAAELAAYTNALMAGTGPAGAQADVVDVSKARVDPQQFPRVAQLFDEATYHSNLLPIDDKEQEQPAVPEGVHAPSFIYEYNCGSFRWPRPGRSAPWRSYAGPYVNPGRTLESWGYHSTPVSAGGGYTRPQTYLPWLCGWSTFRDHAYTVGGRAIREQTYEGWAPRGEPNPEIWRVGPWPYLTWPVYVNWWHSRY